MAVIVLVPFDNVRVVAAKEVEVTVKAEEDLLELPDVVVPPLKVGFDKDSNEDSNGTYYGPYESA